MHVKAGEQAGDEVTQLPFRLGTTSFIYPATWSVNVERLAGRVDDVELLIFEATRDRDLPDEAELAELAALQQRTGLSFTVHTPLGLGLASEDKAWQRESVERIWRVVEVTRMLSPHGWLVHVNGGQGEGSPVPADEEGWRRRARWSLLELVARGVPPERICIESLNYDFARIEPVIAELGLSVAVDVGHLLRDGRSIDGVLSGNLARTRVIHWHGVDSDGRDHRSLRLWPRCLAKALLRSLIDADYRGVLTLEVFGENDFEESLQMVGELLAELDIRHKPLTNQP